MWVWAAIVVVIVCAAVWLYVFRAGEADMSPVAQWWWAVSENGRPVHDDNGVPYRMAYNRGTFKANDGGKIVRSNGMPYLITRSRGTFEAKTGLVGEAAAAVHCATQRWWGVELTADLTVDREGEPAHTVPNCRGELPWWRREIVWRSGGKVVQTWTAAEPRIEN